MHRKKDQKPLPDDAGSDSEEEEVLSSWTGYADRKPEDKHAASAPSEPQRSSQAGMSADTPQQGGMTQTNHQARQQAEQEGVIRQQPPSMREHIKQRHIAKLHDLDKPQGRHRKRGDPGPSSRATTSFTRPDPAADVGDTTHETPRPGRSKSK